MSLRVCAGGDWLWWWLKRRRGGEKSTRTCTRTCCNQCVEVVWFSWENLGRRTLKTITNNDTREKCNISISFTLSPFRFHPCLPSFLFPREEQIIPIRGDQIVRFQIRCGYSVYLSYETRRKKQKTRRRVCLVFRIIYNNLFIDFHQE